MRLKYAASILLALMIGAVALAYLVLRASLPQLDGSAYDRGIRGPVSIERDRLGITTITATNTPSITTR